MTKNYDPQWRWPERIIPVLPFAPQPPDIQAQLVQAANPFSEMNAIIDNSLAHPPEETPAEILDAAKAMARTMQTQLVHFAAETQHAHGKTHLRLFPIRSSGVRYTQDGTAFKKTRVDEFARRLSVTLGIPVAEDIRQLSNPNRSGNSASDTDDRQCYFEGDIEKGHAYIVVDDCVNSGRSVRDAVRYIELNGGRVAGVLCQNLQLNGPDNAQGSSLMDMNYIYSLKPDEKLRKEFSNAFGDQAMVDKYLSRALMSSGQLTSWEMTGLIQQWELERRKDAALTPEAFLQEKTLGWKPPQKPAPLPPVPEDTPTDVELAQKHPGFFGKGSVLQIGNTVRDTSLAGEKLRALDPKARQVE